MGNSFQEQLLKAGLVNKKQVGKIKHEQRLQRQSERKSKTPPDEEGKLQAQRQLAEKSEHSRALNRQRDEEAKEKAAAAQVKQIVAQNRLPLAQGDRPYHFSEGNKIKKLYLSPETVKKLSQGQLAIIALEGKYELVPAAMVAKIRERLPESILVHNQAPAKKTTDPGDPYAAFPIPDDYEW